jgi:nitrogen fixation protein FixH
MTMILPERMGTDTRYQEVGKLTRVESETLVVGYTFDLRTNELKAERVPNPKAGTRHQFVAYRLSDQAGKPVKMTGHPVVLDDAVREDEE